MDVSSVKLSGVAPIEAVSLNYRYVGAWNEVNSRIAQRQNAVVIFVTLSSAIVAVLSNASATALIDPRLFGLLIPAVSLVFGLLNYKHDKTISLLRHFLLECEKATSLNHSGLKLVSYNSSAYYRKVADSVRNFHDYSCMALIFIYNALGVLVVEKVFPDAFSWTGWPFFVYCGIAAVSIILVMRATWWPYKWREDIGV